MISKDLHIYNSLSNSKEKFKSIEKGSIGMYVCGPTVYSDVHLGNCRTFISFDVIYRYFIHLGYKVRYVRNITDVGHLEEGGEDRISKKAKLEKLEPMEVAQKYTNDFKNTLTNFNALDPSIEPIASGHIIEQISIIQDLIDKNVAYLSNGSVYFDIEEYDKLNDYGILSGRDLENLKSNSRTLDNQEDKKNEFDFALWKKADHNHLMKWKSPWSEGFPGWHLECTAMSKKYLGDYFDIHGGGMDLKFPHHDCEIAQSKAHTGKDPAKYWVHANMLTLNNKKMSKSTGNNILPVELITGKNNIFSKPFDSNVIRFFFLQAHYRNVLDISDSSLIASEKGYNRLLEIIKRVKEGLVSNEKNDILFKTIKEWENKCYACLNDDFNSPMLIAELFNSTKFINDSDIKISNRERDYFLNLMNTFLNKILGINFDDSTVSKNDSILEVLKEVRDEARINKNYDLSDKIRDKLSNIGVNLNDKD
ncbi:cysteine--tRNA ligase [Flavobacteriaceae bacterium]|nr:cysteine--tRNA ligase [Flavobacteriaceae bacterium]MDC0928675.1 cysteine--tRNA ligase [Flavobacteriaceae bacterium]MDC0984625.1 cysteine--tRNA ligase [Flavobacteriaceae bacterium]|tara:strand:+ start:227 stop:1660 length:1434 start_codon:yes stop_codon:yes gene_type:complete